MITNQNRDGPESTTSLIKPLLMALYQYETLTHKFFSFLSQLCESKVKQEDKSMHIKSLMTKPALIQLMSFGTMMLDQFKAEYVGMQVVSIYGKLALEQTKKRRP